MVKGKRQAVKDKGGEKRSSDKVHLELETMKSMLARALADYDNLNKRVERERQNLGKIASISIVVRLLPILDGLESAQAHLQDAGLAISIGEFKKVFSEEGLTEIKPKTGDGFDENLMEVIETVPGEQKGKVADLILVGWKFTDGQVVRHAKVKVYN
jgi:molecular chaperone GrpE